MIEQYIAQIARFSTLSPSVSLEIGAYDGEYSAELSTVFNIPPENVYLVEPNPDAYGKLIQQFPKSRTFGCAISEEDGSRSFNAVTNPEKNKQGCSSLMMRVDDWSKELSYRTVRVPCMTGAQLLSQIDLPVDLCIVDVEGLAYEVLHSFGDRITQINSLMLECEHAPIFRGQRLFDEVARYLRGYEFELMAFQYSYPQQSDTVWAQKKYIDLSRMRPLPDPMSRVAMRKGSDTA